MTAVTERLSESETYAGHAQTTPTAESPIGAHAASRRVETYSHAGGRNHSVYDL